MRRSSLSLARVLPPAAVADQFGAWGLGLRCRGRIERCRASNEVAQSFSRGDSRERPELPVAIQQRVAGSALGVLDEPDCDQVIATLVKLLELADQPGRGAGQAGHPAVQVPLDAVELVRALAREVQRQVLLPLVEHVDPEHARLRHDRQEIGAAVE